MASLQAMICMTKRKMGMNNQSEKPPLGLVPKFIRQEQRKKEVERAIKRYEVAGYRVPDTFFKELAEIEEYLQNRKPGDL